MSAFALSDCAAYHTYSAYARGLDGLWGAHSMRFVVVRPSIAHGVPENLDTSLLV